MILNNLNRYARKILNKKMYFTVRRYYFSIRKIRYGKYLGEKGTMYCPCCGNNITNFIDFEYKGKHYNPEMYFKNYKNTICPICCSLPRQRMVAAYIEQETNNLKGKKILFFAPSYAGEICMKRLGITYQSADLYQFADLKIDIQNICIADEEMDAILCNHVLEHVLDYKLAIREMYRILKNGGMLELSVPQFRDKNCTPSKIRSEEENWKMYGQADHLRIFGMDIKEILTECGFEVTEIEGKDYTESMRCKTGPAKYDIDCIYICKK